MASSPIPLWKDRLEIDPGIRYSDYDTVGNVTTYKLLGQLKVNDWVRFRGGYQYANRAPNVVELFTPIGGSSLGAGADPCGNWITTPGGPSLTQTWGNNAGQPEPPERTDVVPVPHDERGRAGLVLRPGAGRARTTTRTTFSAASARLLTSRSISQFNRATRTCSQRKPIRTPRAS